LGRLFIFIVLLILILIIGVEIYLSVIYPQAYRLGMAYDWFILIYIFLFFKYLIF